MFGKEWGFPGMGPCPLLAPPRQPGNGHGTCGCAMRLKGYWNPPSTILVPTSVRHILNCCGILFFFFFTEFS